MASQALRDLLWVINSPSFVTGENVAGRHALSADEVDSDALDAYIAARPVHRVGRYFEHLLHFWLRHVRRVDIQAAGLQILDGKRTVGEIDYLYRNEADQLVHCEASVKFFLHFPRAGESHYPGPNASDNFELKTTKLFDQQLQLSKEHVPNVSVREAFVKGMVFYQTGSAPPEELPERMAADHLQGSWIRASELDRLRIQDDIRGAIADKPNWLAPASAPTMQIDTLIASLRSHFASERTHPLMVSLRDGSSNAELDRLFVVSDRWPERS